MVQFKTFSQNEEDINKWLEVNKKYKILDIKRTTQYYKMQNEEMGYYIETMIIYGIVENEEDN